jgi:hypothetical protein
MARISRLYFRARRFRGECSLSVPIQRQDKRLSERCKRAFGGICFCSLERDVVHLSGRRSSTLTRAVAFTNDGRTIGVHGDPHFGDVDGEERSTVFTGQHTAGFKSLPVPAVEAEDPIGFRDRVPALDIGELATVGLTGADTKYTQARDIAQAITLASEL